MGNDDLVSMGRLVVIFISLVIALVLLPVITDVVEDVKPSSTLVISTLLDLVPLFFTLTLLAAVAIPAIRIYKTRNDN